MSCARLAQHCAILFGLCYAYFNQKKPKIRQMTFWHTCFTHCAPVHLDSDVPIESPKYFSQIFLPSQIFSKLNVTAGLSDRAQPGVAEDSAGVEREAESTSAHSARAGGGAPTD